LGCAKTPPPPSRTRLLLFPKLTPTALTHTHFLQFLEKEDYSFTPSPLALGALSLSLSMTRKFPFMPLCLSLPNEYE